MLLLLSVALADDSADWVTDCAAPCRFVAVDAFPPPEDVLVPLDVQPVFKVNNPCPGQQSWLSLQVDDGSGPYLEQPYLLGRPTNLARLTPPDPLLPDTLYEWEIRGSASGGSYVTFRTGTEVSTPFTGSPELLGVSDARCGDDTGDAPLCWLELQVRPVEDPLHGSALTAFTDEEPNFAVGFGLAHDEELVTFSAWIHPPDRPEEVCFTVVQTDAADREVGRSDSLCGTAEPTRTCGCGSAPRPGGLGWLLAAGAALLEARRRGRSSDTRLSPSPGARTP